MAPQTDKVTDRARGRWRSLLPALGVGREYLSGKHGPCPVCKDGGKDRFRFDDKDGNGSYFCNTCGAGSGVDLVMHVNGMTFMEAKKAIEAQLPTSTFELPKAAPRVMTDCSAIWRQCLKLTAYDAAGLYLAKRGLKLADFPTQLRFHPSTRYVHDDKSVTYHPALVALFAAPDASDYTLHTTFLDAEGNKAALPKVRKLAARTIPKGGAVRLFSSAATMGIAEGIETALSAAALFDVPVWSALSAGGLIAWEPPAAVQSVLVFGDCDGSFAGQAAAYSLAHRLRAKGLTVDVRVPDDQGDDWNDILRGSSGAIPKFLNVANAQMT